MTPARPLSCSPSPDFFFFHLEMTPHNAAFRTSPAREKKDHPVALRAAVFTCVQIGVRQSNPDHPSAHSQIPGAAQLPPLAQTYRPSVPLCNSTRATCGSVGGRHTSARRGVARADCFRALSCRFRCIRSNRARSPSGGPRRALEIFVFFHPLSLFSQR